MRYFWFALVGVVLATAGAVSADTVISGAGNGVGNRISVSGSSGKTVIQGSRWGVGNRIEVEKNGSSVKVEDDGVTIDGASVPPVKSCFWSKRVWSEKCNDYLYWSTRAKSWYRFDRTDRAFYPLEVYPDSK
jgi:hypothetical protein